MVKKYFYRVWIIITSVIFLVGCDQTTKIAAHKYLSDKPNKEIAGIINLQFVENDGGMLSIGSKLPQQIKFIIFILVVSVFLMILFFYIVNNRQDWLIKQFGLILILSGGFGNLIDRIFNNGNVIDFIRLRLPLIEKGIFNIADFYVTMGFLLLLIRLFVKQKSINQLTDKSL